MWWLRVDDVLGVPAVLQRHQPWQLVGAVDPPAARLAVVGEVVDIDAASVPIAFSLWAARRA
jgi:hypothetical protein